MGSHEISIPYSVYADYTSPSSIIFCNRLPGDIKIVNLYYYKRNSSSLYYALANAWVYETRATKYTNIVSNLSYTNNPIVGSTRVEYEGTTKDYTNLPLEGVYWGGSC